MLLTLQFKVLNQILYTLLIIILNLNRSQFFIVCAKEMKGETSVTILITEY
jgi:hypothetical protein